MSCIVVDIRKQIHALNREQSSQILGQLAFLLGRAHNHGHQRGRRRRRSGNGSVETDNGPEGTLMRKSADLINLRIALAQNLSSPNSGFICVEEGCTMIKRERPRRREQIERNCTKTHVDAKLVALLCWRLKVYISSFARTS